MTENIAELKCPSCGCKLSVQFLISSEAYKEPKKTASVKEIQKLFPQNLLKLVTIEEKDVQTIIVKPKEFLGKERFSQIANIVKEVNGRYVSAGRDSHFTIPR